MTIAGLIFLKRGRDGPVRGGNPWIFSQAIARVEPAAMDAGDWVEVIDAGGDMVGVGYYNPATTIAVRMLSFDPALKPGDIIRHRIRRALALRQRVIRGDTDCYRLINGDGDGLSGVVVDRYGGVLVVQLLTAGADRMRAEIVAGLKETAETVAAPSCISERSHGAVRKQEGLGDHGEVLAGVPPAETIAIENGVRLAIDFDHGQKTGAFLDQRDNRAIVRDLALGARVLDAYCYAGGFTLAALAGGAREVVAVDSSDRALAMAQRNLELNGHRSDRAEFVRGDVLRYLADRAEPDRFDVIVLDPPPLARSLKDAHARRPPLHRPQRVRDARAGAGRLPDDLQLFDSFSRRGFRARGAHRADQIRAQAADDRAAGSRPGPSGVAGARRGRISDRVAARGSRVDMKKAGAVKEPGTMVFTETL